jgi:hypothetical protein
LVAHATLCDRHTRLNAAKLPARAIAFGIRTIRGLLRGETVNRQDAKAPRTLGSNHWFEPWEPWRLGVLAVHSAVKLGFADDRAARRRRRLGKPVRQIPNAIPLQEGLPAMVLARCLAALFLVAAVAACYRGEASR